MYCMTDSPLEPGMDHRVRKCREAFPRPQSEASESNENTPEDENFGMELWELCPLDKSHYAKRKNMEQHLIRCKHQFLKCPKKVECPYNPLHIINRMEIEEHLITCENRVTLINSGIDFEPKRELIEGVPAAPLNTIATFDTHWENEEHPEVTYDPMESTKFRDIFRQMPPGLSKSQKKKWKAAERHRCESLSGKTRQKPRPSPYPSAEERRAGKPIIKTEAVIKEEASVMDSIISGLSGAKIGDPRTGIVKQINARLKVLQMMRIKVKEEEIALQRQVEEYLASIVKTDDDKNEDPRLAGNLLSNITANLSANVTMDVGIQMMNVDPISEAFPNIMSSSMLG